MSLNKDMGDAHEHTLVGLFGGKQARGSGNQWRQPMDGRTSRKHLRFAFAWDGKSTLGKSLSIPLTMIRKAKEQAGGNRPMIALRFYDSNQPFALKPIEDWVAVKAQDMAEVVSEANTLAWVEAILTRMRENSESHSVREICKTMLETIEKAREQ